jgi:formate--tetrahydrofolate ligase
MPNLVQTLEGTPALLHGGPFANIAHGCSSILATRMALNLADWTITEAGFGFDLGGEKFFDIKCAGSGLDPAAVVLVATIRALKMHGGIALEELEKPDPEATRRGLPNLEKHIESARRFDKEPIVALNAFAGDSKAEMDVVRAHCEAAGLPFAISEHHTRGGAGAEALARVLIDSTPARARGFRPLYARTQPVREKILEVARAMYGARDVEFTHAAEKSLKRIERLGYADLPVCIAKVPGSLSDDPALRGRPHDFEITVREIQISAGAGYLVVLTGEIVRMPGLPRKPRAEQIDLDASGEIIGLE